jgi:putative aminopeptidase FrvX
MNKPPAINIGQTIDFLMELLALPSPSGYIEPARKLTQSVLAKAGIESHVTPAGTLLARIPGAGKFAPRLLMAHLDVLGLMVKEIDRDGSIIPVPVGSFRAATVEGEYVTIHTLGGKTYSATMVPLKGSVHVHGEEGDEKRVFKDLRIRLDEDVAKPEDVAALGIKVGDYVTIDPRPVLTPSGYIKGRGLDDKAGAAAIVGAGTAVVANKISLPGDLWLCFTEMEEGGYAVPGGIPADVEEILALDMGVVGLGQTGSERKCSICAKDSRGPYNRAIVERLAGLASELGIAAVVDVYPRYGSEAINAVLAGAGTARSGLIGPGVACSHAYERTHRDGLAATVELTLAYLVNW